MPKNPWELKMQIAVSPDIISIGWSNGLVGCTAMPRTALLIRYSQEEAAIVHQWAAREHRTISGHLLHVLERSLAIEERFGAALTPSFVAEFNRKTDGDRQPATTATLLRCTSEQAARIRKAAQKRDMSISHFVVFSLHRYWRSRKNAGL